MQIDGGFFEFDEAAGPSLEARFDYRIVPSGDGVTVTWRDVSERYQAERERAHSEEMFRATVESMLDPVVILRAVRDDTGAIVDFVYFYFNDAAARPTRYRTQIEVGRSFLEVMPERMGPPTFARYARVVETGEPLCLDNFVFDLGRGDEPRVEVVFDLRAVRSGDGVTVTWRDVTERHRAELALRETEALFHATFDRAPAGVVLVSLADESYGTVLEANDSMATLTGLDRDTLVGSRLVELLGPEGRELDEDALARIARGERTVSKFDAQLRRPDGETREVQVRLSAVTEASEPYAIKHIVDISERLRFEQQLQRLADHDSLTGLFNRRRFGEELTHHLALAERHGPTGAVLMLDLDNFKYVNDSLGHQVGDQLIRDAALLLKSHLRTSDTLARLGGDEFVVLLPDVRATNALTVAEHLKELFEASHLGDAGEGRQLTLSIGVKAIDEAACQLTWEELLAEADVALYAAKDSGRNRAVVGDDTHVRAPTREGLTWAARLRTALDDSRLVLFAQPVIALNGDTGKERHELLVRLPGADGVIHGPDEFLPMARRFGLIERVDREVIAMAMSLAANTTPDVEFAVNVAAESISDANLADYIAAETQLYGVSPSRLMFEITETAAISNIKQASAFATNVRERGCGLALDDFGAGFASFLYLKQLPFDYLKIDGSFIQELSADYPNQVMVQSMVQAARGLGKRTIAEWVDDEDTLTRLTAYGVDFAQGYHIARPVPATELIDAPRASA